jgi:hypothetical protein
MSITYNEYLGAKKCCNLKVQGAPGSSSIGSIEYQGATGAQEFQGATGVGAQGIGSSAGSLILPANANGEDGVLYIATNVKYGASGGGAGRNNVNFGTGGDYGGGRGGNSTSTHGFNAIANTGSGGTISGLGGNGGSGVIVIWFYIV